jgi:cytochrome b
VVAAALTGFILGATSLTWHLIAGATVMAAVVWRVIWGLFGPTYARFTSFAYRAGAVLAYLQDFRRGRHHRHLGHNPLGAMMVFALLVVLTAIGLTGVMALRGMLKQGPLRAFLSYAEGTQALDLHNLLAVLLLAMICTHVAGVAFESWRSQENLLAAMLTGNKPAYPTGDPVTPRSARPRAALTFMLAVLAVCTAAIDALTALPGSLVPPTALDPVFALQCGSCHLAFPPSLAPASTWNGILSDLQHHFGADATLSATDIAQIRTWLDANSAEHWDTLPAHLLRDPASNGSLRITDTPGWRRRHSVVPLTVFAAKPVYRRSNCAACHAEAATGQFAPQEIAVPGPSSP